MSQLGALAEWLTRTGAVHSASVARHVATYAPVRVGDVEVRVPLRAGLGGGNLKPHVREMGAFLTLCRRLGYEGTFVDVGANIGQCLLALLSSGVDAGYLGIEPDVEAGAYIADLIRANGIPDAEILVIALGAESGMASMHTSRDRAWAGSTLDASGTPAQMYHHAVSVPVVRGDVVLTNVPRILGIKVDVEGFETAVLDGLSDTIGRVHPPLYVEVLGYDHFIDGSYGRAYFGELSAADVERLVATREANGKAVEERLRNHDYSLFQFDDSGRVQSIDRIDLAASLPGCQGERNVVALSAEAVQRL